MAPLQGKRARSGAVEVSRKRQRIESSASNSSKDPHSGLRPISVDELAWKEVTLPDRFEDAEGFFGLEEIENVQVVTDIGRRKIQYMVGESSPYEVFALQSKQLTTLALHSDPDNN